MGYISPFYWHDETCILVYASHGHNDCARVGHVFSCAFCFYPTGDNVTRKGKHSYLCVVLVKTIKGDTFPYSQGYIFARAFNKYYLSFREYADTLVDWWMHVILQGCLLPQPAAGARRKKLVLELVFIESSTNRQLNCETNPTSRLIFSTCWYSLPSGSGQLAGL